MRKMLSVLCVLFFLGVGLFLTTDPVDQELGQWRTEYAKLLTMFKSVEDGIVYCYSGGTKTTGFFVREDGWVLTAGHKIDKEFPEAYTIHVILDRKPLEDGEKKERYESTQLIPPINDIDLLLFKIDYKPKHCFKKFKKPYYYEENWIFGFRSGSGKVPGPPGFITFNIQYPRLGHTTASSFPGNSGSPVINRDGDVLGVLVKGYHGADGLFVPIYYVKKYLAKIPKKK